MSHTIAGFRAMELREREGLRLLEIKAREADSLRRELQAAESHIERLEKELQRVGC